jgi:hypothetical protein
VPGQRYASNVYTINKWSTLIGKCFWFLSCPQCKIKLRGLVTFETDKQSHNENFIVQPTIKQLVLGPEGRKLFHYTQASTPPIKTPTSEVKEDEGHHYSLLRSAARHELALSNNSSRISQGN